MQTRLALVALALVMALMLPVSTQAAGRHTGVAPSMTHHIDMLYVTVTKTAREDQLGAFDTPDAGNRFLTIWITVHNHNDVPLYLSDFDFKLYLSNGQSVDAHFTTPEPALKDSAIDAGGSMAGTMTYEVPRAAHRAQLRWAPSPSNFELHWPTATWVLSF